MQRGYRLTVIITLQPDLISPPIQEVLPPQRRPCRRFHDIALYTSLLRTLHLFLKVTPLAPSSDSAIATAVSFAGTAPPSSSTSPTTSSKCSKTFPNFSRTKTSRIIYSAGQHIPHMYRTCIQSKNHHAEYDCHCPKQFYFPSTYGSLRDGKIRTINIGRHKRKAGVKLPGSTPRSEDIGTAAETDRRRLMSAVYRYVPNPQREPPSITASGCDYT
jgi:hypothetical protein